MAGVLSTEWGPQVPYMLWWTRYLPEIVGSTATDIDAVKSCIKQLGDGPPWLWAYSWGRDRYGGPADCTGFVTSVGRRMGVIGDRERLTTTNLLAGNYPAGWRRVTSPNPGDVLIFASPGATSGHAGVCFVPGSLFIDSGGEGSESNDKGHLRVSRWRTDVRLCLRPPPARMTPLVQAWNAHRAGDPLPAFALEAGFVALSDQGVDDE